MIIPDTDFITALLNIRKEDIEECSVFCREESICCRLTLKGRERDCPYCGGRLEGHGYGREIPVTHPTLSDRKSVILFKPRRYLCKNCRKTITQENPFTYRRFRSSYELLNSVMMKLGNLSYTLKTISEELHISQTQINTYLDSYITITKRPLPECLGIDEIYSPELSHKGSAYLCVLVDNEKRCLYDVPGSRSKHYLDNQFRKYPKEERDKVKYVTIDMWEPYKDLVHKHFKNASVAVDPFHVVEHLCRDFAKIRIRIMNQTVYGSNACYLLKKWHWLLEKDDVYLDNEPQYNSRFFNKEMSYEEAKANYDALLKEFEEADIKEYREFVSILKKWKEEILNSFLRPYENRKLSNAFCENINGKIRAYIVISRGIANFERFRKRVLFALNPEIFYSLTSVLSSLKLPGKKRSSYRKTGE